MPFTPVHWIPALIVSMLVKKINVLALLLGSTLIDIEPLYNILIGVYPHHTVASHSLLALITVALPCTILTIFIEREIYKRKVRITTVYLSAALGVILHLLFDVTSHYNLPIFFPIYSDFETFYDSNLTILLLSITGIIFLIVYFYKKKELKEIIDHYINP